MVFVPLYLVGYLIWSSKAMTISGDLSSSDSSESSNDLDYREGAGDSVGLKSSGKESVDQPLKSPERFKLDPSKIEILRDENEEKPIDIHVHCDKFLGGPSESIEALFQDIPLHDPENWVELTEDIRCTPYFVKQCHLISNAQLKSIIAEKGDDGIRTLHKIGCLQRVSDYSIFLENHMEVLKEFPISSWTNWTSFPPQVFLNLVAHNEYSTRLTSVKNAKFLKPYLESKCWKTDAKAWELIDSQHLQALIETPEMCSLYVKMLQISIRFPVILQKKTLTLEELKRVPLWSLRVFATIQSVISHGKRVDVNSELIISLAENLKQLYDAICVVEASEEFETDLKIAKTSILMAPQLLFSALDSINGYDEDLSNFVLVKNHAKNLSKLVAKDKVIAALNENLIQPYNEASSNLLSREEYCEVFEALVGQLPQPRKQEVFYSFLHLHMRPRMSGMEVAHLKKMIMLDVEAAPKPEDPTIPILRQTPLAISNWILNTWRTGNQDLFDFVAQSLKTAWDSQKLMEELIFEIANEQTDLIPCAIFVVEDPNKALNMLTREEIDGEYLLEINNVSFDKIHELPLRDDTFFGPSFELITDTHETGLDTQWFKVKFLNEAGGTDGGGPSRNWIHKMLHALADPRRFFLKHHGFRNEVVPAVFVHHEIFFGLGRLIGKGILLDSGLPFAFHPLFVKIIKDPTDKAFIKKCFEEFYGEELKRIDGIASFIGTGKDGLEELEDYCFLDQEAWTLTTDLGAHNVGLMAHDLIKMDGRLPIGKSLQTGQIIFESFDDYLDSIRVKRQDLNEKDIAEHKENFIKKVRPFGFKPKSDEDVQQFVDQAKAWAFSQFEACISSFLQGLDIYIEVQWLSRVKDSILTAVFCPSPDIDVEAMLAAFNLSSGAGLTVEVSEDDLADIDEKVKLLEPALKDGRRRIAIADGFAIALRKLKPLNLLPDLLGQITGARAAGFSSFHPNLFHVSFSPHLVARPLIPDDQEEASGDKCAVSPLAGSPASSSSSSSSASASGSSSSSAPSPSPNGDLELPFTVSCTRTINMPLYRTLKELCLALKLVAKASDEFPRY